MIRRLARFALDSIIVYLVADIVLELGGRAEQPAPAAADCRAALRAGDVDRIELLDQHEHLLATFYRE